MVTAFFKVIVKSDDETIAVGIRKDIASKLPEISGITFFSALTNVVDLGIRLSVLERPREKSFQK
jgi:hypothetical protein